MSYNVVLEYAGEGSNAGNRFWTTFSSKEEFERSCAEDKDGGFTRVVAEGVSNERCIELCHQTPVACRISAVIQDATDPDGNVNMEVLQMKALAVALALNEKKS